MIRMGSWSFLPGSARWQNQLVRLFASLIRRRTFRPLQDSLFVWSVERLHRRPHFVDSIVEEIANQEIGHGIAQIGELAHELAKAEACVVLAHQTAHAIDAVVEVVSPGAEPGL